MSTMWFEKRAGMPVSQGIDEPTALLIDDGESLPDWVRTPPNLGPLGNMKIAVESAHRAECPMCGANAVRHLRLAETAGERLGVVECPVDGFVWYRRKDDST